MKTIKPQQEELHLRVNIDLNTPLIDKRIRTSGIMFGTVRDIAKNLGVRISLGEGFLVFSAPKNRLQLFCEKLHFSGVKYKEI